MPSDASALDVGGFAPFSRHLLQGAAQGSLPWLDINMPLRTVASLFRDLSTGGGLPPKLDHAPPASPLQGLPLNSQSPSRQPPSHSTIKTTTKSLHHQVNYQVTSPPRQSPSQLPPRQPLTSSVFWPHRFSLLWLGSYRLLGRFSFLPRWICYFHFQFTITANFYVSILAV